MPINDCPAELVEAWMSTEQMMSYLRQAQGDTLSISKVK